jgi:carbamoyl-phosphate synthase small subunit
MKAILLLEDGTTFDGAAIGAEGTVIGEVVFNTAMTGYQEVITDPSCYGQIVVMTCPLIGNHGINSALKPQIKGLIVREACNYTDKKSGANLNEYLKMHGITGIEGIDTRALTRLLRNKGTMNGIISTSADFDLRQWRDKLHSYRIINPVLSVIPAKPVHFEGYGPRIAAINFGDSDAIIDSLRKRGCEIYMFPLSATVTDILGINPDGIILSNGPGDPTDCGSYLVTVKELIEKKPILGIGLGHQLVALAAGAKTARLKYGHRGFNHPVKDMRSGVTFITAQNHGYVVQGDIDDNKMEICYVNMNDGTIEGLRLINKPVFTVQFHPEAKAGPKDAGFIYDNFIQLLKTSS